MKSTSMVIGTLLAALTLSTMAFAQARPGALVALPYLTDAFGRTTVAVVTNLSDTRSVDLRLNFINGDAGGNFAGTNATCGIIPQETTYFVFERLGADTRVTFECSEAGVLSPDPARTNIMRTLFIPAMQGIMAVTHQCQVGVDPGCSPPNQRTRHENSLLGSFTVIDFAQGISFSADGIHVQGQHSSGFGDGLLLFDDSPGEYVQFPSIIRNDFLAPDDDITAEMMLFTLDGEIGGGPAEIRMSGNVTDDDAEATSSSLRFEGFAVLALDGPPCLGGPLPCGGWPPSVFDDSVVGRVEIAPTVAPRTDVHDFRPQTGNSNGVRVGVAHGWMIQTIAGGGQFAGGAYGGIMSANGAWATVFESSTNTVPRDSGDTPGLNTNF